MNEEQWKKKSDGIVYYLLGKVMKKLPGANPQIAAKIIKEQLDILCP